MSSNKVLKIIVIISLVLVIGIIILTLVLLNTNSKENGDITKPDQEQVQIEVSRVKNRNNFYTVVSCIDRYMGYLAKKDKDILYCYLDESYAKKNNITKENVLNHIKTYDDYMKFRPQEMYERTISQNVTQYYVKGYISEEVLEGYPEEQEFYISIKIDDKNNTFSVIPDEYITNKK